MALFETMHEAVAGNDAEAYLALHAEDPVFVRHLSRTEMDKAAFGDLIRRMMASDQTKMGERRCPYENDDISSCIRSTTIPTGRARRC